MRKKVAIIGGGASGFFTAVNLAEQSKEFDITIYEASNKLLAKVLIPGGGRCNVTNAISEPSVLSNYYPRGKEFLEESFSQFSSNDTRKWFEDHGVNISQEADGRCFPSSNTSQTISDLFIGLCNKLGIEIKTSHRLTQFTSNNSGYALRFKDIELEADVVVLCTSISKSIKKILEEQEIKVTSLVPSLFTFNAKEHSLKDLSGISVQNSEVRIKEIENARSNGPLLITHWGFSGPAILRLSAWQAIALHDLNYEFTLQINWDGTKTADETLAAFNALAIENPKQKVALWKDHGLPKRLWAELIKEMKLPEYTNWAELGNKKMMVLANLIHTYSVPISGKSTFKEEFVTAGGIELDQLNNTTFGFKNNPNLYAIGEILNIDAITGGFNFQAAWTGAFLAAKSIAIK